MNLHGTIVEGAVIKIGGDGRRRTYRVEYQGPINNKTYQHWMRGISLEAIESDKPRDLQASRSPTIGSPGV